jgi:peptide deformylase
MKLVKFIAHKKLECVGLAAPQLGINERVFVLYDGKEYAIFVNPRIVEVGPMEDVQIEGCVSLPGKRYKVKRATSIVVKDAVRTKPFELSGWTARAWLHELDHLNGKLISDVGEEVTEESVQKPL